MLHQQICYLYKSYDIHNLSDRDWETDEWLKQNQKSTREFLRKWGHYCKHDALLKPIIPPKYDVGFSIKNDNPQLIEVLEPWCSTVYVDFGIVSSYINGEQPNTSFDLSKKFYPSNHPKFNNILVSIDGSSFTQQDFQIIQQLSEIIKDSWIVTGKKFFT